MFLHLLRLCCACCVGFAALLGVLRLEPADDSAMRAFVRFPQGCETACFMGLRPGFTRIDTAIRALDRNVWVTDVNNRVSQTSGSGDVSWRWGEAAPAVINTAYPGRLRASGGVVTAIIVEMHGTVGAWQLALDADPSELSDGGWSLSLHAADCSPGALVRYWFAPARLELSPQPARLPLLSCAA